MTTNSVKWYGDEILKELREATPEGLYGAAEMLVDNAKGRVQRQFSGNLAESGYIAMHNKSTYKSDRRHNKEVKPKQGEAVAAFAIFYAQFVEFGTRYAAAKPFLRPALDELKSKMGEEVAVKIRKNFRLK